MKTRWIAWLAIGLALVSAPAFAQGASSSASVSGVVQDKDGGRIPGATVVVKNDATGASFQTVTNSQGVYSFPAIDAGTYTVTITLEQFKTAVMKDVRVLSASARSLPNTVLEVGALNETIEVKGGSELVRTETPTVSSTINGEFIRSLPRADRNALNFLIFLPGVETSGGAGNARSSTIAGLPQNTINISIDGINTSNNLQSGDGFFSLVVPRLDAIEEVTLTTSTAQADSTGQGATQVRFVTRSGTNQYQTSLYEYFRHKSLNTNTFFNRLAGLPRPRLTDHNYGGRIGGPIVIPGVYDGRGKAFFFFNHEESTTPNDTRRTRTILQEKPFGDFTYNQASPTTINVLAVAAQTGNISTIDPTVLDTLTRIRQSVNSAIQGGTASTTTSSTDPNRQTFDFFVPVESTRHSPTGRVDLNLTTKHRLSGSYYWQKFNTDPDTLNGADPTFPGFVAHAAQRSFRTVGSIGFRSTFSSNLVNQVTSGWQWSPVDFFGDSNPTMFDDQNGYAMALGFNLTNAHPGNANGPQARNTINWNIDDSLNWLRGKHNFTFGFSFTRIDNWIDNWSHVPSATFSLNTTFDPAAGVGGTNMFTTAFFPGASNNDLGNARALYALMTGRITSLGATARLNEAGSEYIYLGHLFQAELMDEYGLFAQDSWRWKPNLTLTLGLRYEYQMPMVAQTANYTMSTLTDLCGPTGEGDFRGRQCNLFNPGSFLNPGQVPTFVRYDPNNPGYATDKNNFAPSIGASWRPNAQNGLLRKILGDPDQAIVSGGFSRSFNRERVDRFRGVFANNPGGSVAATRGTGATQFPIVPAGESWPLLLRQCTPNNGGRCSVPAFQQTPVLPITADFALGQDIRIFDPTIQIPYTDSWNVGLQRALSRDMAVEVRYIGNINRKPWASENWNEENIVENGLLAEFKLAQQNLAANVAAGRGGTFAFTGIPGTSPLPIFISHFTGLDGRNPAISGNTALYTSTNFTNGTFVDPLDPMNANPYSIAGSLWGTGTFRSNMTNAGFPSNFWVLNPLVDSAEVTRNFEKGSNYHSMQIDLRRRFSRGLQVTGSYTFARRYTYSIPNSDLHNDIFRVQSANIPHAIKMLWVYQLPVGRGKRFGANMNRWMDAALGGWEFSGTGRVQTPLFRLTNTNLVGMTQGEVQDLFKQLRFDVDPNTGSTTVWDMPVDIYNQTRLAYDTDPRFVGNYAPGLEPTGRFFQPADGPTCTLNPGAIAFKAGDCAPDLFFYGPWFGEFDFKLNKKFPLKGRAVVEFAAEVFNALKGTNFNHNISPGTGANTFRITGAGSGARAGQLVWRVSW